MTAREDFTNGLGYQDPTATKALWHLSHKEEPAPKRRTHGDTWHEEDDIMNYEDNEQMLVMEWKAMQEHMHPELETLIHIPNERKCTPAEGARLKRMGVKAGVSDLFLPIARNGKHGLWIELKRREGGRVSEAQREWLERMVDEGYMAKVCNGAEEAVKVIREYLAW